MFVKPDPFEMMLYARRRVFVRINDGEWLMIVALRNCIDVSRWCRGDLQSSQYVWHTAESLGLFDGSAWNIAALATWLGRHCEVCWNRLVGQQRKYCSGKCKQKAYRSRR